MTALSAVLHAHSDWSYDGRWSLDRIARLYGRLGVRAVLMTEHDTGFDPARYDEYRAACAAASTPRCRIIPGIEYSCPENTTHILTWGLPVFLQEHRPVMETLERVAEAGGAAVFAHPVRREAWRAFRPEWVPLLAGIELWNRKSDGIAWGKEAARLIEATGLPATVGQDFHHLRHAYPLTQRFTVPDCLPPEALEATLMGELRARRSVPCVFGRLLLRPGGAPGPNLHLSLEKARRSLRDAKRGVRKALR